MSRNSGNNGSGTPQGQGLDVQQLMQMGEAAANLLQNPIYLTAHQLLINDLISQMVTSEPHESKKRDYLHMQVQSAGAVAQHLAVMVERAKEELKRQSDQNNDYLDRQGFGLDGDYNAGFADVPGGL